MLAILSQSMSLLLIIILGYIVKRLGLIMLEDGKLLGKIIMYITLPATAIQSLNGTKIENEFIFMLVIAIILNIFLSAGTALASKNFTPQKRTYFTLSQANYNIGNFVIPFLYSIVPATIPYVAAFDIGNAIMVFGFIPALVDGINNQNTQEKSHLRKLGQSLTHSPAFMTYCVMLVLLIANIELPTTLIQPFQIIANANSFLSMFMIGIFLEIRLPREDLNLVIQALSLRYGTAIIIAIAAWFLLPLSLTVKIALISLILSPIATMATLKMVAVGIDPKATGFISSASIVISLLLITAFLTLIA
ncbi:AEC family transporter [Aerococcus kribbianus]|uniref:Transporter n=1 Tax=Aerococcus kribbianus TaxID=2999064 RepID=A0A9X3FML3_9LACT|nr:MULTISPECIES: hypothetical protein [unclassified Aerococcus]MCZ0717327.1 hypothetical protein [Aerococcus sp. YH-aer221]MCZ0725615.1 hypothetical protein [Aerococcus sp. YH-aer222]